MKFKIKSFENVSPADLSGKKFRVIYELDSGKSYELIIKTSDMIIQSWIAQFPNLNDEQTLYSVFFNYGKDKIEEKIINNEFTDSDSLEIFSNFDYGECVHCMKPDPIKLNEWFNAE